MKQRINKKKVEVRVKVHGRRKAKKSANTKIGGNVDLHPNVNSSTPGKPAPISVNLEGVPISTLVLSATQGAPVFSGDEKAAAIKVKNKLSPAKIGSKKLSFNSVSLKFSLDTYMLRVV